MIGHKNTKGKNRSNSVRSGPLTRADARPLTQGGEVFLPPLPMTGEGWGEGVFLLRIIQFFFVFLWPVDFSVD
jgi:hypothetical protein